MKHTLQFFALEALLVLSCLSGMPAMAEPSRSALCRFELTKGGTADLAVGGGGARYGLFHISACNREVLLQGRMSQVGSFEAHALAVTIQRMSKDGGWVDLHGLAGSYSSPSALLTVRAGADAWIWIGFFVGNLLDDDTYRVRLAIDDGQAHLTSIPFAGRQLLRD